MLDLGDDAVARRARDVDPRSSLWTEHRGQPPHTHPGVNTGCGSPDHPNVPDAIRATGPTLLAHRGLPPHHRRAWPSDLIESLPPGYPASPGYAGLVAIGRNLIPARMPSTAKIAR